MNPFSFSATWSDKTSFPDPAKQAGVFRTLLQKLHDETKDFINNTVKIAVDNAASPQAGAAATWQGTIASGTSVYITHNLGYYPLFSFDGTVGNTTLTTAKQDNNTVRIYCYGNEWTGTVYMF